MTTIKHLVAMDPATLRVLRLFEDCDLLFGNTVGRYYGGALSPGEIAWLLREVR